MEDDESRNDWKELIKRGRDTILRCLLAALRAYVSAVHRPRFRGCARHIRLWDISRNVATPAS